MLFLATTEESGIMMSLLRTILMNLCNFIYKLIIYIYELFLAVGNATILNSEQIQVVYTRVGLILGIVMIFRLIFSFVQYMIDPDKITDKETGVGSIVKKFIVVILALALTDLVFIKAFELQETILEENVIAKVVLGVDSKEDIAMDEFGVLFSYNLFTYFFYQNPEVNEAGETGATSVGCGKKYFEQDLPNYVATFKDFEAVHKCLNEDGDPNGNLWGNKVYYASFDGLEALLVGGAVLWILVMYTITLGVRVVKLAFLRLIAPIPILSYLSPKKDTPFQKWIKQCVTTYLDLFIRLAIIYFCMLLISIIFASDGVAINSATYLSPHDGLYKWFNIILILGILLFAKKIPEILGEIFPSMGGKGGLDLGFGLKSRTDFMGKGLATRAAGAAIGAGAIGAMGAVQGFTRLSASGGKTTGMKKLTNVATGAATGAVRGFTSGVTNGGKINAGLKSGWKGQRVASQATNKYIASGSDGFIDRAGASIASELGLPSRYERLISEIKQKENTIAMNERQQTAAKGVHSIIDSINDMVKGEVTGDKSNLTIGARSAAFIQQLDKAGFIHYEKDDKGNVTDIKIKYGEREVRNADGSTYKKPILGSSIIGMEATKIDNEFERQISIADTKLNTANANLVNAQTEKISIESRLAVTPQGSQEYLDLQKQLQKTNNEIKINESIVEEAKQERSVYNNTEFVKALRKGAVAEALIGTYDSDDVKQLINETTNRVNIALKVNDEKIKSLENSTDENDKKLVEQFKSANSIISVLNDLFTDIRDNRSYKTFNSDGKVSEYDIAAINKKITDAVDEHADLLKNAINFDDINPDGTYGTKEIKIKNVFDVIDQLGDFTKKLERGQESITSKLKGEVEIAKNSEEVLRASAAQENTYTSNK